MVSGGRWQGAKEIDPSEEEYFNTSDDEEYTLVKDSSPAKKLQQAAAVSPSRNGNGRPKTPSKPLVDYDDDDDAMEGSDATNHRITNKNSTSPGTIDKNPSSANSVSPPQTPKLRHVISTALPLSSSATGSPLASPTESTIPIPERLAEKRRRTELDDDDDELGKLSNRSNKKRTSPSADGDNGKSKGGVLLQRKRSGLAMSLGKTPEGGGPPAKKIAISLGSGKTGCGVVTTMAATANSTGTTTIMKASSPAKTNKPLKGLDGEEEANDSSAAAATVGEDGAVIKTGNGDTTDVTSSSSINSISTAIVTTDTSGDGGGGDGDTMDKE